MSEADGQWRVGRRNPHTVYRQHGDEPRGYEQDDHDDSLGYFRFPADAQRAVDAVNGAALHTVQELNAAREQGRQAAGDTRLLLAELTRRRDLNDPSSPRYDAWQGAIGVVEEALGRSESAGQDESRDRVPALDVLARWEGCGRNEAIVQAEESHAEALRGHETIRKLHEKYGPLMGLDHGIEELRNVALAVQHEANRARAAHDEGVAVTLSNLSVRIDAHRCAPAAPEVVSGAEAAALPRGSRFVVADEDDLPEIGMGVRDGSWLQPPVHPEARYVVLHRADRPEPALAVGDRVETAADLDRLPVGARTVGTFGDCVVSEKYANGWGRANRHPEGDQDWWIANTVPARVLDLPTS